MSKKSEMNRLSVAILLITASLNASAQYPGKPNCDAINDPTKSLECMAKNADCSTPGWLNGADRASCAAEDAAKQSGLQEHRKRLLTGILNMSEKASLKLADTAYDKFIQAQCRFENGPPSGPMYANNFNSCLYYYREQRLNEYPRIYKNFSIEQNR